MDAQLTQPYTLVQSHNFIGAQHIDKYTKDTVKYSALTKDRHEVIYCASVQLADNLDNQSHNLHLPDWDRNRENRDYHWKMGSRK